jgi:hypothetical protein
MPRDFRAVAIISAHNEADIIAQVVRHLIAEGISVYLLDHASTDGTLDVVQPFLGQGLLGIEPFPKDGDSAGRETFVWEAILARKSELSVELDADWFLHHDADEIRESPWDGVRLIDGLRKVDRLGYNAVDFELLDFWPVDDRFQPGDDPTRVFRHYELGRAWNKRQVKCWKKQNRAPDLVSSGGHDVMFPDRRVFPLRFILRHYPIRSSTHGARKVWVERVPRFVNAEIRRGWHLQYNDYREPPDFLRKPDTLAEYDGDAVRLALVLNHRDVEKLRCQRDQAAKHAGNLEDEIEALKKERDDRNVAFTKVSLRLREQTEDIDRLAEELRTQHTELQERASEVTRLRVGVEAQDALVERLVDDVETQRREILALYASKTWRWTAPVRALYRLITKQ